MLGEFEFIQNIKKKYSLEKVGDDCAVLPKDDKTDQVITADLLVEDIDFRLEWTTPELLGHKALAVSLSDIAAMGAEPKWAMLSLGVPKNLWNSDFVERFYKGWHGHAKRSRTILVGGDISRTRDKFVVDSIVLGEIPKGAAIFRSGAEIGDAIVVTFRIGGSAGGLRLLEGGHKLGTGKPWEENLLASHLEPWPQTGTGIYLQKNDLANAMIDISDGLSSDLTHLCEASKVGAKIYAEQLPLNLNLKNLLPSRREQLDLALNGGEDFELLFTLPKEKIPKLSEGMIGGNDYGLFTVIGEITSDTGKIELIRNGKTEILLPKGYRHF